MGRSGQSQQIDLALRLQRFEDERSILRTLHRYCKGLDYWKLDDVVATFAPNGILDVVQDNAVRARGKKYEHGVIHSGINQITFFYRKLLAPGPNRIPLHHFITNSTFEWHGETVRVDSLFVVIMANTAELGPRIMTGATFAGGYGRYLDDMVRGADGVWRFARRQIVFEAGITARRQR